MFSDPRVADEVRFLDDVETREKHELVWVLLMVDLLWSVFERKLNEPFVIGHSSIPVARNTHFPIC